MLIAGCGASNSAGQASDDAVSAIPTSTAGADPQAISLLRALGARRLDVMAGADELHAGLGVIGADGLRPLQVLPGDALMSTISGNGHAVVLDAATRSGGFYLDGVYRLVGRRLVGLAKPGSGQEAASISPAGVVAAIHSTGGFALRRPGHPSWDLDTRLRHTPLGQLSWDAHGDAFTVTHPGTPSAELVEVTKAGPMKILGAAYCAAAAVHAPSAALVATSIPTHSRATSGVCGRKQVHVLSADGSAVSAPRGWDLLAWSANSQALLSRRDMLAAWQIDTRRFLAKASVSVPVWMAAPIYR